MNKEKSRKVYHEYQKSLQHKIVQMTKPRVVSTLLLM